MTMDSATNYDRTSYILVVDDDNTLLKFFKIHLNKFFSKVIVVKNAREAIDTLREKEIDLVITDIRMPRMNGLQLLKRVRKINASIPVLVISGALLTEEQEDICLNEADGFLRKPFTIDELHVFIQTGMNRRRVLQEISELLPTKLKLRDLIKSFELVSKIAKDKQEAVKKLLIDLENCAEEAANSEENQSA